MEELKWFASFTKKALTAKEMRAVELNAEALGVSELMLMENAGSAVARFVEKKFSRARNVLIICGTGNNGGDGFAAARHLSTRHNVTIAVLGNKDAIKSLPARINLHAIENSKFIDIVFNAGEGKNIEELVKNADIIIDAVFGTGFHGALPQETKRTAKLVERSGKPVVAIDLPSGVYADGGNAKDSFKATYTLTMHKPKIGLLEYELAGKLEIVNIGIPIEAELYAGPGDLFKAAAKRKENANKYSSGRVLVIAGSDKYHGAPALVANAAQNALASLRIGAGYVVLLVPEQVKNLIRKQSENIIVKALGERSIGEGDETVVFEELEKSDALAIGPGIGTDDTTLSMASKIIERALSEKKKIVIDADALLAIRRLHTLSLLAAITPHDGEFKQVYGSEPGLELRQRAEAAIGLAKRLNANVVLKGHTTIITNGSLLKINTATTPALATMGTGDVLAGIIAGYAATGASMFDACVAGVYLHSRIGDALAVEKGMHILATDVVEKIPSVLKSFDMTGEE